MANFHLEIVSMDGQQFSGEVERVVFRSIAGDVAILSRHTNYCTAVGMGTAKVVTPDGVEKKGACIGGMISMMNNTCRLIPTTWEWGEHIDVERAKSAKLKAEETLKEPELSPEARARAEAKLYRALIRLQTASGRPE